MSHPELGQKRVVIMIFPPPTIWFFISWDCASPLKKSLQFSAKPFLERNVSSCMVLVLDFNILCSQQLGPSSRQAILPLLTFCLFSGVSMDWYCCCSTTTIISLQEVFIINLGKTQVMNSFLKFFFRKLKVCISDIQESQAIVWSQTFVSVREPFIGFQV